MRRGIRDRTGRTDAPWPVARDVFCLGPAGRTRTNVYFVRSGGSWVLIDAGWPGDTARIRRAADVLFGTGSRPYGILLTHDHPDHEGAALPLARTWECPVFVHPDELPVAVRDFAVMTATAMPLDRWVVMPVMRAMGRRRREAMFVRGSLRGVVRTFRPEAGVPGLPDWECVPTPGHTPGHVSYFRPADRVLISGDALVTCQMNSLVALLLGWPGLSEPPWYTTWNRRAARESIGRLVGLEPAVLAAGHGTPLTGPATAASLRWYAVRHGL